jgi:surface carbohydrate biosynthesis protein
MVKKNITQKGLVLALGNFWLDMETQALTSTLSKSHIVVFIDSTVGYEALSRGKRTAAFVCRVIGKPHKSESFGWPADLPDSGSFWSNETSEKEFERIMDYLNSIGDREWAAECRNLIPQIMAFDEGNKHLEVLLNKLLPSRD